MSIRHLRTLIAVAEHGSFAAAAQAVFITQSAVSQQMKALEEELGAELFDRDKRPPQLNPRGKALIPRARQLVNLYNGLREQGQGALLEGMLEIGAVHTAVTGLLPHALGALRAAHPSLQVRVVSGLSAELQARVERGNLDAAIITEPKPAISDMRWHPVAEESLVVIAAGDETLDDYREILERRPFIRFNRKAWVGQAIDQALKDMDIKVNETMELDTLEASTQMVRHGLGVSIVPLRCVDAGMEALKTLPFGSPPRRRTIGLIERYEHPKMQLTQALFQKLYEVGNRVISR